MRLSAQEEYGLRCLLHVARCAETSLTIPAISRAEGLSAPNVAKLMRLLRLGGWVLSARGQAGGYTLTRPPEQIRVGDVLESLGGRIFTPDFCDRHAGKEAVCTHDVDCSLRVLWSAVQRAVGDIVGKITLRDLLCSEAEMHHRFGEQSRTLLLLAGGRARPGPEAR